MQVGGPWAAVWQLNFLFYFERVLFVSTRHPHTDANSSLRFVSIEILSCKSLSNFFFFIYSVLLMSFQAEDSRK